MGAQATFTAKNKMRKHRYAFKDGSVVKMAQILKSTLKCYFHLVNILGH